MKKTVIAAFIPFAFSASAQGVGVSALGGTGGLNIPSAYVLSSGESAWSIGNEQDPRLGVFSKRRNYSLGFGLGGGVEIFGRLVEYQNPVSGLLPYSSDINGPRDISANLKWAVPHAVSWLPKMALGANDLSGGAVYFKSVYGVVTDEYGPVRASLGVAKGTKSVVSAVPDVKALNGVFGGVEARVLETRATVLAETDGERRHIGARYYSEPLAWLGDGQLIGTLQRSTSGVSGLSGKTSFNVSAVLPLGANDGKRSAKSKSLSAARPLAALKNQAVVSQVADKSAYQPLVAALQASGLDRIRVGVLGADLVVEYENYRYLHNEVDALGIVLGLAAELAPEGTGRIYAIALKSNQVVAESSVGAASYRAWLRDEAEDGAVRRSFGFGRLAGYDAGRVAWQESSEARTKVRLEVAPALNYTVGTEYGLFDYSLALKVRPSVGLWPGAQVYADVVQKITHSQNMDPQGVFASSRHKNGLKTLALQQNLWLNKDWLLSAGAGLYQYKAWGMEGEAVYFLPDSDDTLHIRGRSVRFTDSTAPRFQDAWTAAYRWRITPSTWLEGGINAYSDATRGPSLMLTRWFGDVALNMHLRKGGSDSFVGLEVSVPLTPREGGAAGAVQWQGAQRFDLGFRTLMAGGNNTVNFVKPDAVRPVDLSYKPEVELFNSGRVRLEYVVSQLPRMRESFYMHARGLLP